MGLKKVSFLLACICVGLLSGCKATPDTEAIAQKVDINKVVKENKIEVGKEKISSVVKASETEKFELKSKDGKSKISVDAKVTVPDATAIPAVKVTSKDLATLDLEGLSKYFFEGEEYTYTRDISEMSKPEIAKLIEEQKKMMEDESMYEGLTEEEKEMNKQGEQEYLLELQGYYDKAPETVEIKPVEYKLQDEKDEIFGKGVKSFSVQSVKNPDEKSFSVYASNYFNSISYYSAGSFGMFEGYFDGYENKCKYSEDEAKKKCEEIIEKLGVSGEYKLVLSVPTVGYSEDTMESQAYYNGYEIIFKRVVNDVEETYDTTYIAPEENENQSEDQMTLESFPKQYENILFNFGEQGLSSFSWSEPMVQKEVLAENLKLISYDEAIKIFKKKVFLNSPVLTDAEEFYGVDDTESQSADEVGKEQKDMAKAETTYKIKEIKLGLMRVKNKDNEEEYTLVPVWDFYGESDNLEGYDRYTSYLTISAIDGSIIDRSLGY